MKVCFWAQIRINLREQGREREGGLEKLERERGRRQRERERKRGGTEFLMGVKTRNSGENKLTIH